MTVPLRFCTCLLYTSILFPELEKLVPTLHQNSVYELLYEFPGAKQVANAHLTRLSNLLETASKGHYTKETSIAFREAARTSIGSNMPAKSLELKHTIKLIRELDSEIEEIENEIKAVSYTHLDVYKRQGKCHPRCAGQHAPAPGPFRTPSVGKRQFPCPHRSG